MLLSVNLDQKVYATNIFNNWNDKVILSMPVIRNMNGNYRIAYFVFPYDGENYSKGRVTRPTHWLECDIETGEVISIYKCEDIDFMSNSSDFAKLYDVVGTAETDVNDDFFSAAYELFDAIRNDIILHKTLYDDKYQIYNDMVLKATPEEYRVFYHGLSLL